MSAYTHRGMARRDLTQTGTCKVCAGPIVFDHGWQHTEELEAVFDGPWGEHRAAYATAADLRMKESRMKVTWDELMTAPDDVPRWFSRMVESIKIADHVGDVWDTLLSNAPSVEARKWLRTVINAEYNADDDTYETEK